MLPIYAWDYLGGTFKWLLVGDDDTVFFRAPVKQALEHFDHTLPYFLTDSFFNQGQRPRWDVPTCLPCHSNNTSLAQPRGCPCKPEVACRKPGLPNPGNVTVAECVRLWDRKWRWHAFGGAGWILSAGLVEQLAKQRKAYEMCAWEVRDYGDRTASACLWRLGFAPTEFSTAAYGDRGTAPRLDSFGKVNNSPTPKALLIRMLQAMKQPGSKQHQEVTNMLSWHLKERALKKAYNNSMVAATVAVREVIDAVEQLHNGSASNVVPTLSDAVAKLLAARQRPVHSRKHRLLAVG
jgi:hypothetical protein